MFFNCIILLLSGLTIFIHFDVEGVGWRFACLPMTTRNYWQVADESLKSLSVIYNSDAKLSARSNKRNRDRRNFFLRPYKPRRNLLHVLRITQFIDSYNRIAFIIIFIVENFTTVHERTHTSDSESP